MRHYIVWRSHGCQCPGMASTPRGSLIRSRSGSLHLGLPQRGSVASLRSSFSSFDGTLPPAFDDYSDGDEDGLDGGSMADEEASQQARVSLGKIADSASTPAFDSADTGMSSALFSVPPRKLVLSQPLLPCHVILSNARPLVGRALKQGSACLRSSILRCPSLWTRTCNCSSRTSK